MRKINRPTLIVTACIVIGGSLAVGGILLANHHNQAKADARHNSTAANPSAPEHAAKSTSSSQSASTTSTSGNTAASDAAVSSASTKPVTIACKLLTSSIASQVLGSGTKQSTASDTTSLQANDTSVTACAYSGANGSTQLAVRTPTGSLGASENATAFGSDKPADAIPVQGYGQTAYWDPGKDKLNILGDNNWYIITCGTNTQADAEAVAKLLSPGF